MEFQLKVKPSDEVRIVIIDGSMISKSLLVPTKATKIVIKRIRKESK